MNGIISQEVAILLYELNIQPPTCHYYAIEKNILENVDYTYLRGIKPPKHTYYAYGDRTPKRLDVEYDNKYVEVQAYTYAEVIEILKERFDLYISIRPYQTYSTMRGYAFGAVVYDLQPKWNGERTYTYDVDADMCIDEDDCLDEVLYKLLTQLIIEGRKCYTYILWLDDRRDPNDTRWHDIIHNEDAVDVEWCRNRKEFCALIQKRGIPKAIYFDHDLGDIELSESGYGCARWLVDYMMDNNIDPSNIEFYSQSDNQPGKENILQLLTNFKYFNNK